MKRENYQRAVLPDHRPYAQERSCALGPLCLLFLSLLFFSSCAKQSYYDINTRTDYAQNGNVVIRWQVNPGMEGRVKIFASADASSYPTVPTTEEPISKQIATIPFSTPGFSERYFLMVFDGRESRVVSNRTIPTQSFTNLRDIGGYMTKEGYQVKWGVIFRGNRIPAPTDVDKQVIATLNLKNNLILDQNSSRRAGGGDSFLTGQKLNLPPDVPISPDYARRRILKGEMDQPAVIDAREDLLSSYAFENPKQLSTALHFLLDETHYPILLSDSLGNGRVAVLTALIQSALGVPQREIINDYMLSNMLIPVARLEPEGYKLPAGSQEALIEFYKNRPNDLQYIFYEINRRYGSIESYLSKFLSFDTEDIEKLKAILLY